MSGGLWALLRTIYTNTTKIIQNDAILTDNCFTVREARTKNLPINQK